MAVGAEAGLEFPVGEGMGVKPVKTGVTIDSVTTGDTYPEGVDACSVANRSGVGEKAGAESPHPSMNRSAPLNQNNLALVIIQLD